MGFDSSLITYTVSLHFEPDAAEIISSIAKSIAELTGNRFSIENKIPPHITIGAFHAKKEDEAEFLQIVEEFSKNQEPGTIQFQEVGNFKGKVLFLKPEKNNYLTKVNEELHKIVLPQFEKAENGYYLPEIWFPHTTLATRLNQIQLFKAMETVKQIKLPLEVTVNEISVYRCTPGEKKEIDHITFCRNV